MLVTIASAAAMFAATNLDDILVLTVLFAQAGTARERRLVVAGQYLGIGVLVLLSIVGGRGVQALSLEHLNLIGIVPILMAARMVIRTVRKRRAAKADGQASEGGDSTAPASGTPAVGMAGAALFTISNGADNIGIWLPYFAVATPGETVVAVAVFALMTGAWCVAGRIVAGQPVVAHAIDRHGAVIVPAVLTLIGLSIIAG